MKVIYKYLIFFIFSTFSYATDQDSLISHMPQETFRVAFTYLNLLYDQKYSMRAGTENILTVHYGITRTEDELLGTKWFSEQSISGKTGGILLRSVKYNFLDCPIDCFSYLLAHEYFGHGARIRELTNVDIRYKFNLPPPYGKGSAWTQASLISPLSSSEMLAIYEGGIESQAFLNRTIALHWMATSEINYRDAALYIFSLSGNYHYIQSTSDNLSTAGSDPELYLKSLNAQAGFTNIKNLKMSVAEFKSKMKLSLANPFYYFSMYYFLKTYLWDGNTASEFPAFRIGRVHYLPVLRAGLTPFGPDYHLENYLRFGNTASLIDIRVGDQTFYTSWGGVGFTFINIYSWNRYSMDLNVDIWKQPELMLGISPGTLKGGGLGGAFSMRGYYNFTDSNNSLSAIVELGYKSVGFLEGYRLDASPVFMIGLGFRP